MFTVSCLVIAALQLPAPADTVQRTIVGPSGSPELSLVEPGGALLGTVRLPIGQSPATATGDRLLVTTRGPLGVPVLIQYRLSAG